MVVSATGDIPAHWPEAAESLGAELEALAMDADFELALASKSYDRVVFLGDAAASDEASYSALLQLVQGLMKQVSQNRPLLWLCTRDTQKVASDDQVLGYRQAGL